MPKLSWSDSRMVPNKVVRDSVFTVATCTQSYLATSTQSYLATGKQLPNNQYTVTQQPGQSYLATSAEFPSNQYTVT